MYRDEILRDHVNNSAQLSMQNEKLDGSYAFHACFNDQIFTIQIAA